MEDVIIGLHLSDTDQEGAFNYFEGMLRMGGGGGSCLVIICKCILKCISRLRHKTHASCTSSCEVEQKKLEKMLYVASTW